MAKTVQYRNNQTARHFHKSKILPVMHDISEAFSVKQLTNGF